MIGPHTRRQAGGGGAIGSHTLGRMEKLAYLLWDASPERDLDAFRDRLLDRLPKGLADCGASRVKILATDSDVAAGAGLHLGALAPDALVTFWLECVQDRGASESLLSGVSGRMAGYLVVESQPLRFETPEGPVGRRLPGFTLVGCIEPADGVAHAEFIATWERVHRDVAIETQSTFSYVRHEVVPAIRTDCNSGDIPIWTAGASIGAFHAVAVLCRWPQLFHRAIGMSGTWNILRFFGSEGRYTEDYFVSSPLQFVPTLAGPHLAELRKRFVLIASGAGRAENMDESWGLAQVLGAAYPWTVGSTTRSVANWAMKSPTAPNSAELLRNEFTAWVTTVSTGTTIEPTGRVGWSSAASKVFMTVVAR